LYAYVQNDPLNEIDPYGLINPAVYESAVDCFSACWNPNLPPPQNPVGYSWRVVGEFQNVIGLDPESLLIRPQGHYRIFGKISTN
jgi:hypothetical protein